MIVEEKFSDKLLVEGNDDQHIIWQICEKFKIKENFDVIDCNGIDNLIDQIPTRFLQTGIKKLGLIVDADDNLDKRWLSILGQFLKRGINLPKIPDNEGTIMKNSDISVGIWLMPDNKSPGLIEDFISFLIPQSDNLLPITDKILLEIENENLNRYKIAHKSKAKIHTWLAWQENPGTPMGAAINKKYLNIDQENCYLLVKWLKNLFS